ncbi:MAG: PhoH family protein [Candidatus Kapabacteria bacterium]|nr:PhoH family protein [Ignavibacteriota bacterium]MCW5886229.1 PhoH family protein [Candidatus Kapabacteria bacterium]
MAKRNRKAETEEEKIERQAKPLGVESDNTIRSIILSDKQKELIETIEKNDITICTGPAGTSKTFIDCYYAVKSLKLNTFDKVLLTKPIQEAGEKLGFLPGDIESKIDPHYESYKITFQKLMKKRIFEKLLKENVIEFRPLAFMRGATFDNSLMILDEAQNCDIRQLMLFTTRMGNKSKVIISGDLHQYDINAYHVALQFFVNMVRDIKGIGVFEFEQADIVRNKILIEITERYEKLKFDEKLPRNKS